MIEALGTDQGVLWFRESSPIKASMNRSIHVGEEKTCLGETGSVGGGGGEIAFKVGLLKGC